MAIDDEYVSVLFVEALPNLNGAIFKLVAELEGKGAPNAASLVERAAVRFWDDLDIIAARYSLLGTEYVIAEEESSRVRPDSGEPDSKRMTNYFQCDIISALPGSVGYINKSAIDDGPAKWWWTQEIGYSGHVNRELHGWFFESGWSSPSRPDPGQNQHPLFGPMEVGPPMTIKNPIVGRHFAEHALDKLEAEWRLAVQSALNRLTIAIEEIMSSASSIIYAPIP